MRGLTDIYATLFRTDLAVQFQYRAEMIIWLIFRIVEALVFLSVWTAVADSQGGQVGGFSAGDFAAYYIAMMMMRFRSRQVRQTQKKCLERRLRSQAWPKTA